ncbi:MAG TPA: acyl-CoA desaturase, partial [Micromonospora sp.]
SRPYPTRDNSRNVAVLAPLSAGGSWHNNHHAQPASAFNRHAFWQVDMIGGAIRLLEVLGLVTDVRRPRKRGDTKRS